MQILERKPAANLSILCLLHLQPFSSLKAHRDGREVEVLQTTRYCEHPLRPDQHCIAKVHFKVAWLSNCCDVLQAGSWGIKGILQNQLPTANGKPTPQPIQSIPNLFQCPWKTAPPEERIHQKQGITYPGNTPVVEDDMWHRLAPIKGVTKLDPYLLVTKMSVAIPLRHTQIAKPTLACRHCASNARGKNGRAVGVRSSKSGEANALVQGGQRRRKQDLSHAVAALALGTHLQRWPPIRPQPLLYKGTWRQSPSLRQSWRRPCGAASLHRRLRVLETRWTTSPERRFPPLNNRLPCRVRSGSFSAARPSLASHALVVFKSLLLVVVTIPADLCGPNAAELRPPWPPPLGCHWRSLARWTRQQMPSSSSSRFFSSLSPFPQTYAGPNTAELSIKAPYEV